MTSSPISNSSPYSSNSSPPAPTRGRPSVQALLAELSDSDSDTADASRTSVHISGPRRTAQEESQDDTSEDDFPIGGGRLTNRLAGNNPVTRPRVVTGKSISSEGSNAVQSQSKETGEDGASERPKKKLLLKRKRAVEDEDTSRTLVRIRSPEIGSKSPTPIRSGSSTKRVSSPDGAAREDQTPAPSNARFQQLVEKARKEREAREEAERAKKAARDAQTVLSSPAKRRQRGSSPADNSEEDSDQSHAAAAIRLSKAARPTRKASKKALEEMNRETQRMTRNMQLAHQARTKKKFTKESFLASFTGSLPAVAEATESQDKSQTPETSLSSSDTENDKLHSTPPTSPLRSPILNKATKLLVTHDVVDMAQISNDTNSFEDMFAARRAENSKPNMIIKNGRLEKVTNRSSTSLSEHEIAFRNDSDSDSDIEVVHDLGHKRKYVAFENLPKRKAKEMPSHLALRSLALIKPEKDKRSIMSRADMGPSLMRAARRQALEERREKIEKLKAAGVVIQTAEEKEQDEEELENLLERARQEDEEIRKREKELAKRDGTYVKDALDDENSDEDEDFLDEGGDEELHSEADSDDGEADNEDEEDLDEASENGLVDDAAEETTVETGSEDEAGDINDVREVQDSISAVTPIPARHVRKARIVLDDDDSEVEDNTRQTVQSPALPSTRKTPQSILRSTRKVIPGLQHSDDLPIGLTQAFAATMAESQTQDNETIEEQDSMDILRDLPSPQIDMVPRLNRLESLDLITESVPATQTQSPELDLGLSQSQRIPESPAMTRHLPASQAPFELTQDAGYSFSPFAGNRFAETPRREPHSTEDTVILPNEANSPSLLRKGRLQRGRQTDAEEDDNDRVGTKSAFQVMSKAAERRATIEFNKKKSEARQAVDEAAEESDDEYAGLGGASDDDSNDEENDEDRQMIDEDTQVGQGDEATLAKLHADRERAADEAAVNKMMKDIATGALRRKRGAGDDLDLSDEEDARTRRREAKRREFAKMKRELLKDEAVSKIAEDRKKEAFLKSIEDRDDDDEEEDDFDEPGSVVDPSSEEHSQQNSVRLDSTLHADSSKALRPSKEAHLNQLRTSLRRAKAASSRKPGTLAEIRESVSFLIEEPDSQAGVLDLGLSDSEEPEAYVDLDRHLHQAEADEDAMNDENADLGGFVVDDEAESNEAYGDAFKMPEAPNGQRRDRAPFSERRTTSAVVIDRLSLRRQASASSATSSGPTSKMAFFSSKAGPGSLINAPSLLRRATTNSSLGSMSGRENVSATGVVTSKTERGNAAQEKDFVRKGTSTSRNAVNYQGRQNLKEEKMSVRAGIVKKQLKKKSGGGLLGSLFQGDSWE